MTEKEILEGSDLICGFMGFEKTEPFHYKVPNLFPYKEDSGWMELRADAVGFDKDWNLLIPVFDNLRVAILGDVQTRSKIFAMVNVVYKHCLVEWPHLGLAGRLDINGSFLKVVDLVRWYNENCK